MRSRRERSSPVAQAEVRRCGAAAHAPARPAEPALLEQVGRARAVALGQQAGGVLAPVHREAGRPEGAPRAVRPRRGGVQRDRRVEHRPHGRAEAGRGVALLRRGVGDDRAPQLAVEPQLGVVDADDRRVRARSAPTPSTPSAAARRGPAHPDGRSRRRPGGRRARTARPGRRRARGGSDPGRGRARPSAVDRLSPGRRGSGTGTSTSASTRTGVNRSTRADQAGRPPSRRRPSGGPPSRS